MLRVFYVVSLGLEPRLFWTKTRRVASYTMRQSIFSKYSLKKNGVQI